MMCRRVFLIWTLGAIVSAEQNSTRADDEKAIRDLICPPCTRICRIRA